MPGGLPEPTGIAAGDAVADLVADLVTSGGAVESDAPPRDDQGVVAPAHGVSQQPSLDHRTGPRPAGDGIDPAERTPRSFHLSRRLLERARAAAYWAGQAPAAGEPTNVSELVERALRGEVERLERTYNGGAPFPAVVGKMRTGPGASGVERIRRAQRARRR
ncbi:MAG: hypothetical protein GEU94_12910 [Micromonosporaceae bacterium]|nr:hypothetical protein [Micromonosporaceae bacterium]